MRHLEGPVKEKILSFFDVEVKKYLNFLQNLENQILNSPIDPDGIQITLNNKTYELIKKGHEIEGAVENKPLADEIKQAFKNLIFPWTGQSIIMKRSLEKPRGFAGDYRTLEYIYDNVSVSRGIGNYFDRGFLSSDLAAAVRNRKEKMKEILKDEAKRPRLEILNIACGPCRELRDLVKELPNQEFNFTCIDFDEEALEYAEGKLKQSKNVNLVMIKEDVTNLIRGNKTGMFRNKDLIYSLGLIDYLPDRILRQIIQTCLEELKEGGKLILSHKDRDKYNPVREDWLTDWKFIPRNEEKIYKIIEEAGGSKIKVEVDREPSGIIMFLAVSKR